MKNINLAWFLLLTLWPAIISNGWWVMSTCNLSPQGGAVPVGITTVLLSLGYVALLFVKFLEGLDERK